MTELTIDYTLNSSGPCLEKCFTIEMYTTLFNSKINNGKSLDVAMTEIIEDLMLNFNPINFNNTITNHDIQCFFNSKTNIGTVYNTLNTL